MNANQIVNDLIKEVNPDFLNLAGLHIWSGITGSILTVNIAYGFEDNWVNDPPHVEEIKKVDLNHPESLPDLSQWLEDTIGGLCYE